MGAEEADAVVSRSKQAGVAAAKAHRPDHADAVRRLSILGIVLTLAVIVSLLAWVRNTAADRATVSCQAAINEQWRIDAAGRSDIAAEDRALVDTWIRAVDHALNAPPEERPAQILRDATEKYLTDRAATEKKRADKPVDTFTGRC